MICNSRPAQNGYGAADFIVRALLLKNGLIPSWIYSAAETSGTVPLSTAAITFV